MCKGFLGGPCPSAVQRNYTPEEEAAMFHQRFPHLSLEACQIIINVSVAHQAERRAALESERQKEALKKGNL